MNNKYQDEDILTPLNAFSGYCLNFAVGELNKNI